MSWLSEAVKRIRDKIPDEELPIPMTRLKDDLRVEQIDRETLARHNSELNADEKLEAERDEAKDQLNKANSLVEHYKTERDEYKKAAEVEAKLRREFKELSGQLLAERDAIKEKTIEECALAAGSLSTEGLGTFDERLKIQMALCLAAERIRALKKPQAQTE